MEVCTEAICLDPNAPQLFLHRAQARMRTGDPAGAVLDFDECLRLQPSAAFALMGRGGAKVKLGDIAGACRDFLAASKLRPQDTVDHLDYEEGFKQRPPKERARLLALRGNLLKNRGREVDLQESLEHFTEALKLGGADTATYRSRAEVKALLGDTDGALQDLSAGLAGVPSCAATLRSRADLKKRCGDKVGALEDLDILVRSWPEDLSALLARGDLRRALGDLSGAIADYNTALRIDPNCKLAAQGKRLAASRLTLRESVARTSRAVSMVVDLDQVLDEGFEEELAGEEY